MLPALSIELSWHKRDATCSSGGYWQPLRNRYCGFAGFQITLGSVLYNVISSLRFFAICHSISFHYFALELKACLPSA